MGEAYGVLPALPALSFPLAGEQMGVENDWPWPQERSYWGAAASSGEPRWPGEGHGVSL